MGLPALRPLTGAILLVVSLIAAQPVLGPLPARAQQDPANDVYTVRNVTVDITAESAAAARDQALVAAQRKAFEQLLGSLGTESDVAALPALGDNAISDMVLDFEIESEKVSTVRYIGDLTFRFRAEPVRKYLERGGATYAVPSGRPALVIPVLAVDGKTLLWDDANAWLAAWSQTPVNGPLVPIAVPLGDLADIGSIDGPRAVEGDLAALQAMAQRYGAGDVVVAEAEPSVDAATGEAKLALSATRYKPAGSAGEMKDSLSAAGGEDALPALYAQAAQRVSDFLQEQWKQENLVSSTAEQHLDVVAPIASLAEWVELRRRLADVTIVRRAELITLSRRAAEIDLVFIGDQGQLTRALAQRNLILAQAAAAAPPPAPAAPQTTGSVTVYPEAAAPAAPLPTPRWELRMSGQAIPATATPSPAAAPAGSDSGATTPSEPTAVVE
jgi:hypothetical protein